MSIRKTKSGKFQVRLEAGRALDGSRKQVAKTFKTLKEAKQYELDNTDVENSGFSAKTTLNEFVDVVYLPLKKDSVRYSTFRNYAGHLRLYILPVLGELELNQINHVQIQKMINAAGTWKNAKNAHATLRNVLNECINTGMLKYNPAREHYRFPERKVHPENHNGVVLNSFEEIFEFLTKVKGSPSEPLCVLGLCFGLRKGEILGLDWQHVDFANKLIKVRQTYTDDVLASPKTEKSVRDIPMNEYAYRYLRDLKAQNNILLLDGSSPVALDGGKRYTRNRSYKVLMQDINRLDLPQITLLSMRHSFATSCINSGIDVAKVSKMLGHTDITTTYNKYVRPSLNDIGSDMDKINKIMYGG